VVEAADIREWRDRAVLDLDGHKIGELEAIYVDTSTDLPAFGTVRTGMPGRYRLVFVPVAQAIVGPGYLKVAYHRKQSEGLPLDQHRRRTASDRRRGHLQALQPALPRQVPAVNGN
jgi:hypothetical protein